MEIIQPNFIQLSCHSLTNPSPFSLSLFMHTFLMSLIILIQKIEHVSNRGFSSEHTTHGPSVFSVYIVLPKAPEILEGQGVGPETDIWAVGVLSFIM